MNEAWSWVLTAFGLTGLLLAGRDVWWGWLVNLCAQSVWFAYGALTGQPGFMVSALLYGVAYALGARRARAGGARGERGERARVARSRGSERAPDERAPSGHSARSALVLALWRARARAVLSEITRALRPGRRREVSAHGGALRER